VPLPPGAPRDVHLDASDVITIPGDGRSRSFVIKNVSFENLSLTDLFSRGWHSSGYLFGIKGADTDGWVNKRLELQFPATERFKEAIVEIVRYPSKWDLSVDVSQNGASAVPHVLGLEQTERIRIPLSKGRSTPVIFSADQAFPLAAPDMRIRSYRVVNIDFD
jgi:hypothetical protein